MENLRFDYDVSAALDFGTTFCGVAYSLKEEYLKNPLTLNSEQQNKGDDATSLQKPTTVLVDTDCNFLAFGDDAERTYGTNVLLDRQHCFLFRHFKMNLHREQELTKCLEVEDLSGKKKMRALTIFSIAIAYWVERLHKLLETRGFEISREKVRWVLTVPGMWSEKAKQYMREAAEEAGIPNNQLVLVHEPEAAAILCKTETVQKKSGKLLKSFDPGTEYLVVDMGGGTVDTTVQKVKDNGYLTSLKCVSGGPFGGNTVNTSFFHFIRKIVGVGEFEEFKRHCPKQYLDFESYFEREKRKVDLTSKEQVFSIPFPNRFDHGQAKQAIRNTRYSGKADIMESNLVLDMDVMRSFFEETTTKIVQHVENVLTDIPTCKSILLVGGFAASPYVKEKIKERFEKRNKIVFVPVEAGNAVLKGAVIYGHNPNIIAERVSPFTYGLKTRVAYTDKYPIEKRKQVGDRYVVDDVFQIHIKANEVMTVGKPLTDMSYRVIDKNKQQVYWEIYKSSKPDPMFCDESLGSKRIGKLEITLKRLDQERKLKVKMTCRGTELEAIAIDEGTGDKVEAKLNFFD